MDALRYIWQLPSRREGAACDSIAALQQHCMGVATPKLRATTTIIAEAAALLAWLSPDPHEAWVHFPTPRGGSERDVECCMKRFWRQFVVASKAYKQISNIKCGTTPRGWRYATLLLLSPRVGGPQSLWRAKATASATPGVCQAKTITCSLTPRAVSFWILANQFLSPESGREGFFGEKHCHQTL